MTFNSACNSKGIYFLHQHPAALKPAANPLNPLALWVQELTVTILTSFTTASANKPPKQQQLRKCNWILTLGHFQNDHWLCETAASRYTWGRKRSITSKEPTQAIVLKQESFATTSQVSEIFCQCIHWYTESIAVLFGRLQLFEIILLMIPNATNYQHD